MGRTIAILVARLIFAGVFALAASFKFGDIAMTAEQIASVGFPMPTLFAWLAAFFEVAIVLAFLTGAYFSEAALLAGLYVIVLNFLFHGPSRWEAGWWEFGFFVDHFSLLAGLLFAAVHGPGEKLALRYGLLARREPSARAG